MRYQLRIGIFHDSATYEISITSKSSDLQRPFDRLQTSIDILIDRSRSHEDADAEADISS